MVFASDLVKHDLLSQGTVIPKFGEKEKHEFALRTRPYILGFLDQIAGWLLFPHILNTSFLQKAGVQGC